MMQYSEMVCASPGNTLRITLPSLACMPSQSSNASKEAGAECAADVVSEAPVGGDMPNLSASIELGSVEQQPEVRQLHKESFAANLQGCD